MVKALRAVDQIEHALSYDEREAKLPKWVQDKMARIRQVARHQASEVDRLRDMLADLADEMWRQK